MISSILSRVVILLFGTLYPAYASYKAVKTKNVKEYVKWMMYWIVFALFTCTETFTDIFFSWFPFYYEIKIILVIWLLSPATKGSSILYRKFVHPMLSSREQEIDDYISKAKEQSYRQVLDLGQKGVTVLMQTAIKGGGGIVNQLKKSYSLSDLSDPNNGSDETDDVIVTDPRLVRRRKKDRSPHRSSSASSASVYFSEVDVTNIGVISGDRVSEVRSAEDISSGYSSGEGLYGAHHPLKLQSRESTSSQRTSSLTRSRSSRVTRSTVPKKSSTASDDSDGSEVFDSNIVFAKDDKQRKTDSSSSETEFYDIPENNVDLHGKGFRGDYITRRIIPTRNDVDLPVVSETYAHISGNNLSNIIACNQSYAPLNLNLTKLSAALSSLLFSSASNSNQTIITELDNTESVTSLDKNKLTNSTTPTNDMSEKLLVIASESSNIDIEDSSANKIETNPMFDETKDDTDKKSTTSKPLMEKPPMTESKTDNSRGGKYNKKQAPLPPSASHTPSAIKAKLVLQPGLVRSISNSSDSINKEIFLNYSPKVKRRSRHRSPSSSRSSKSSDSSSTNKLETALNKMLRFPKRMTQLNVPEKMREKRNSWNEFFHGKKLADSRTQSRSASNLNLTEDDAKMMSRIGSQVSIKSLTDSPLAHRRLKIIRRYVDNDID
ncbi:uncharacterized protein LOC143194768 isoform X3 [Rhynchophorus ferrugineus]|uniref:uncharacterized protein LOC143194768 isoform X3 n=1 Tax=Rhynchophorus ferrugineus TaxID=354439 RepID=UPI003FCC79E7